MSDEPKPAAPPSPPPPPEATASPPVALAKGGIDYALPAHKSSWLPSPVLIKNRAGLINLLFGLPVLLGMGFSALMALTPKARAWATKAPKDGTAGPTPQASVPSTPDQIKLAGNIIIPQAPPAGAPRASAAF